MDVSAIMNADDELLKSMGLIKAGDRLSVRGFCSSTSTTCTTALPSLKIGGELSGANCPGAELSDIFTIILTHFLYFSVDFFL